MLGPDRAVQDENAQPRDDQPPAPRPELADPIVYRSKGGARLSGGGSTEDDTPDED